MNKDLNIYTCEEPTDHYDKVKFRLLCKKSIGEPDSKYGIFFEEGKWYTATLEFHGSSKDTNWKEFRACWVSFNDTFGSRYAVCGNVYNNGIPYWSHFTEVFHCPIEQMRNEKLTKIGIN